MPILPPLRSDEGILVPDLSGLRLRFTKHAEEKLILSIGIITLTELMKVGGMVVREGENVIISDESFWMYMTEDTALFQWDPPTPAHIDKDDILLDIHVAERRGEIEISSIPASGIPNLDVGWSFDVYQSPRNAQGCNEYILDYDKTSDFMEDETSKAVVVDRGECTFLDKVTMARKAGFDLVIVVDSGLMSGPRFIPSLLTETENEVPADQLIPLVLVTGRRDASLIRRAEKVRIAGMRTRERRMVVRGGISLSTPLN
jgi:hypothetical protein